MNQCLSKTNQAFLKLLSEGLKEKPRAVSAVSDFSSEELMSLVQMGRFHSVSAILYEGLEACYSVGMHQVYPYMDMISKEERTKTLSLYRIYQTTEDVLKELKKHHIRAVVLKGATVGACYKMPELRKSGDVDLWLPDVSSIYENSFQDAVTVVESMGFRWDGIMENPYHRGYENEVGLEVELHVGFANVFLDEQRNRVMELFIKEIDRDSISTVSVLGRFEFPTLTGADFIFYNLLHMVSHYMNKGFGWKLICDWAMIWKTPLKEVEQRCFYDYVKEAKLLDFTEVVSLLAIRYLGLEKDNVSFLLFGNVSEGLLNTFIKQTFESGDMGDFDKNRMLTPTNGSLKELLVLFHFQMYKNFPKASKLVIIWPALWVFTFFKFLYNNKHLRNVSTIDVIKNARRRGEEVGQMDLFNR